MKNTTENNKMIAEFMGMKPHDINELDGFWTNTITAHKFDNVMNLQFNSDWNWLMEVVEKIKQIIGFKMIDECTTKEWQVITNLTRLTIISAINEVYNACVEFIKWYNRQQINQAIQDSIDVD